MCIRDSHLASQSGNKTKFNEDIDAFVPGISKQNEKTLGAANGIYTLEETLKDSFEKGNLLSKKITNNDSGYETAIEFKKNGIDPIILDTRKEPQSEIIEEAKNMNINIKNSYVVVAAQGYKKVKSADIAKISDNKEELGSIENIECDCICVSGFWTPTIHLASQSGNKTKFNEDIDAFVPGISKQNEKTLGAVSYTHLTLPTIYSV